MSSYVLFNVSLLLYNQELGTELLQIQFVEKEYKDRNTSRTHSIKGWNPLDFLEEKVIPRSQDSRNREV